jgi:putative ABC transport system permease protein
VFSAIAMAARQTLAMTVCSVDATGLIAGIAAVPAGVYLHHRVVPTMMHAVDFGYPASMISSTPRWNSSCSR